MEACDIIKLFSAYYKDKVEKESILKIKESFQLLLEADADARRKTAKEYVLAMARLDICLKKFEIYYNPIKNKFGNITAAENKIASIKLEIERFSKLKNHL